MSTRKKPPRRKTRAEQAALTTQRLLDAAEHVLVTRGFQDASVDDIAAHARLTKGAVYARYDSKEDLLIALFERRSAQTLAEAAAIVSSDDDLETRLAALDRWQRTDDAGVRMWALLEMELGIAAARRPALARKLGALQDAGRQLLVRCMAAETARRRKPLPLPPEYLALAMEALSVGLTHARLVNPDAVPDDLFSRVLRRILGL
jgi:AcrR family transcriptional regulator